MQQASDTNGGSGPAGGWQAATRLYLPDIIFGANDGIVTLFAVVAAVVGARLPAQVALILGFATLVADGFSMGASNYLSKRSNADHHQLPSEKKAAMHGLVTFASFLIGGAVPLVAYVLPGLPVPRFLAVAAATLLVLFAIGALRSLVVRRSWFWAGMEMLVIGAIAAGVAYGMGSLTAYLVGNAGVH